MLTKPPECRAVCRGAPGSVMDELVAALASRRRAGLSEADALLLVAQKASLLELFAEGSLGRMRGVAEAFIESGCATCAVNKAFTNG